MKWISSRRETIPLTEKELVIIKEKETSGSERRWRTGEVVAASPNSMLSPSLCHSVASVKKLYERMKDLESWPSGYGNEKWCVCVFWRAEDSVLGLFYRQLLYSNMPALLNCRPFFLLLSLCPLSPWLFCYITEENQGVELLKRRLWAWWSWGISCYFWNYCWVLDKDGFNHNFNADFKVGPNLRTRF
jgi:hypothetical protein